MSATGDIQHLEWLGLIRALCHIPELHLGSQEFGLYAYELLAIWSYIK